MSVFELGESYLFLFLFKGIHTSDRLDDHNWGCHCWELFQGSCTVWLAVQLYWACGHGLWYNLSICGLCYNLSICTASCGRLELTIYTLILYSLTHPPTHSHTPHFPLILSHSSIHSLSHSPRAGDIGLGGMKRDLAGNYGKLGSRLGRAMRHRVAVWGVWLVVCSSAGCLAGQELEFNGEFEFGRTDI